MNNFNVKSIGNGDLSIIKSYDLANNMQWRIVDKSMSFSTPLFSEKKSEDYQNIITIPFRDTIGNDGMHTFFVGQSSIGRHLYKITTISNIPDSIKCELMGIKGYEISHISQIVNDINLYITDGKTTKNIIIDHNSFDQGPLEIDTQVITEDDDSYRKTNTQNGKNKTESSIYIENKKIYRVAENGRDCISHHKFVPIVFERSLSDDIDILTGLIENKKKQCFFDRKHFRLVSDFFDEIGKEIDLRSFELDALPREELSKTFVSNLAVSIYKPNVFYKEVLVREKPIRVMGMVRSDGEIGPYLRQEGTHNTFIRTTFKGSRRFINDKDLISELERINYSETKEEQTFMKASQAILDIKTKTTKIDIGEREISYKTCFKSNNSKPLQTYLCTSFTSDFKEEDGIDITSISNKTPFKFECFFDDPKDINSTKTVKMLFKENDLSILVYCHTTSNFKLIGTCTVDCYRKPKQEVSLSIFREMAKTDLASICELINLDIISPCAVTKGTEKEKKPTNKGTN